MCSILAAGSGILLYETLGGGYETLGGGEGCLLQRLLLLVYTSETEANSGQHASFGWRTGCGCETQISAFEERC